MVRFVSSTLVLDILGNRVRGRFAPPPLTGGGYLPLKGLTQLSIRFELR